MAERKSVGAEDYGRVQCMAKDRQRESRNSGGVCEGGARQRGRVGRCGCVAG